MLTPVIGTQSARSQAPEAHEVRGPEDSPQAREDRELPGRIKKCVVEGRLDEARELFGPLVERHQRRASRLAYYLLRDVAEADEAVQDAFVKVFGNIRSYREELPFEAWFTKILVNGCLDRRKARSRRLRWVSDGWPSGEDARVVADTTAGPGPSPEDRLLIRERRAAIFAAIETLPARQKTVFLLCHYEGRSTRDVSAAIGLTESTIRVHLFRAVRRLRTLLGKDHGTA
jgi:RNA polymerase sigma-70 factor, ECF subfamily